MANNSKRWPSATPGTGTKGVQAEVIEVKSIEELRSLPDNAVDGKIVFFNRPMDLGLISTFSAYGGAADQRAAGPVAAAEKGAVGVVIRSLSTRQDDYPHTGMTQLSETITNIPSFALSTNDAVVLSKALQKGKVEMYLRSTCVMLEDVLSYNVIGQINGTTRPDEIILVGGHFDSWDIGEGAHDDGSGCVQSMEVLYRLKKMHYAPQRTLRCVFFMNEENGLREVKPMRTQLLRATNFISRLLSPMQEDLRPSLLAFLPVHIHRSTRPCLTWLPSWISWSLMISNSKPAVEAQTLVLSNLRQGC